jgi:hypothetical protein
MVHDGWKVIEVFLAASAYVFLRTDFTNKVRFAAVHVMFIRTNITSSRG